MTDAELVEHLLSFIASIAPEQVPGPFICGAIGQKDADGLRDAYMICPTYGADHQTTALFQRVKK